jgi:hypothetical protein
MRKLYEINAHQFLKFINHPDAVKFEGRDNSAFVDVDEKDRNILYNYEEHPDFENGGTGLSENFEQVKSFVEKYGTEID